jgi:hypothetical protein
VPKSTSSAQALRSWEESDVRKRTHQRAMRLLTHPKNLWQLRLEVLLADRLGFEHGLPEGV